MSETEDQLPWRLARLADCMDPDSVTSPGAQFLFSVEDDARERWEDTDPEDRDRLLSDEWSEVADSAVPIYTREVWTMFVDLGAYQEDPTELGIDGSDMEQAAKVCLYMIAERLCHALADEWADEDETEEDEEGES